MIYAVWFLFGVLAGAVGGVVFMAWLLGGVE